jgi:cytochrome oxidase assembly protein ShyY1
MALLGMWQLDRLADARAYRSLVERRQEMPAIEVEELVPAGAAVGSTVVGDVLYRTVTARGTYVEADTVVVENRTLNASSGAWVLTPLRLDDGSAVLVNRGFLRFDRNGEIVAPAAPSGPVVVEGLVLPSERRGRFGPTDPTAGKLEVLARVDLDRLEAQVGYEVLPAYVQLIESTPGEVPVPEGSPAIVALGPPDVDEGPHLSYAVQWFIFTTIAAGGYVLLLRRVARDEGKEERARASEEPTRVSLPGGPR